MLRKYLFFFSLDYDLYNACSNVYLSAVRYDLRHLFFLALWASISVAIAAFVRANGKIFYNRPRLHKPRGWFWLTGAPTQIENIIILILTTDYFDFF